MEYLVIADFFQNSNRFPGRFGTAADKHVQNKESEDRGHLLSPNQLKDGENKPVRHNAE